MDKIDLEHDFYDYNNKKITDLLEMQRKSFAHKVIELFQSSIITDRHRMKKLVEFFNKQLNIMEESNNKCIREITDKCNAVMSYCGLLDAEIKSLKLKIMENKND